MNISQNARKLVFCGTMTTDGLEVRVEDGQLRIVKEGRVAKFVQQVEQVSFSGPVARAHHQDVLVVSERAVFRLQPEGWELIEVAPGMDLQRDILDKMAFRPLVRHIKPMPLL